MFHYYFDQGYKKGKTGGSNKELKQKFTKMVGCVCEIKRSIKESVDKYVLCNWWEQQFVNRPCWTDIKVHVCY